jgi:hypothetical protein
MKTDLEKAAPQPIDSFRSMGILDLNSKLTGKGG